MEQPSIGGRRNAAKATAEPEIEESGTSDGACRSGVILGSQRRKRRLSRESPSKGQNPGRAQERIRTPEKLGATGARLMNTEGELRSRRISEGGISRNGSGIGRDILSSPCTIKGCTCRCRTPQRAEELREEKREPKGCNVRAFHEPSEES